MILEALRHLLSPCPRRWKRLGVLYDQLALEARARRCREAWKFHRNACCRAVLSAADRSGKKGTCFVLGSGLLLEIPLETLADRFERVVLIDLFHLEAVRLRVRRLGSKVDLLCADFSGILGAGETALERRLVRKGGGALPPPCPVFPVAGENDLTISANCLSQLPLVPIRAAWSSGRFAADALRSWAAAIQAAHLSALASQAGAAFIVADVERLWFRAATGELAGREDLLHGLPRPATIHGQEWLWAIAPAPEERPKVDLFARVIAGDVEKADAAGGLAAREAGFADPLLQLRL